MTRLDVTPLFRGAHAIKDFVDWDGIKIKRGTELGDLYRGGTVNDQQAFWAQKDGFVTAVVIGSFSNRIGKKGKRQ